MVTREILEKAAEHANICCGKIGSEHWMDEFLDSILQFEGMDRDDAWNLVSEKGMPKWNHGIYAIAYKSKSLLEPIQVCTSSLAYWVSTKTDEEETSFECWDRPDMSPDLYKSSYPIPVSKVVAWKLLEPPVIKEQNK